MNTQNDKGMISTCMLGSSVASIVVGLASMPQAVTVSLFAIRYQAISSLAGAIVVAGPVTAMIAAIMLLCEKEKGRLVALAAPVAAAVGAVIWGIVLKVFPLDRLIYIGIYFGMAYFSWAYFAGGSNPTFGDFIGSLTSSFNSTGFEGQQYAKQARARCPKCGGDIDPGAEFCPHCGAKVD